MAAQINYVLNAVNNMSRPFDQATDAVVRLDQAEKALKTVSERLDAALEAQARFASTASEGLAKLGMSAAEAAAMEKTLAEAVEKYSNAQVAAMAKTTAAAGRLEASMAQTTMSLGRARTYDEAVVMRLEAIAEAEDVAALNADLLAGKLMFGGGAFTDAADAMKNAKFVMDDYASEALDAAAKTKSLADDARTLAKVLADLESGDGGGARTGFTGGGGGWWGFLTGRIPLFGGLTPIFKSIAAWHVLGDAIFEVASILIPAGIAFGAFAFAASDAVTTIVHHMSDLHTVMDATRHAIAPMTGAMEALHKAVAPAVYQLFGDALTVMNARTGVFADLAKGTAVVVDQLGARIAVAVKSGNAFDIFLRNAVTDVYKVGTVIGNLLGTLGAFLKAVPEFSQFFLNAAIQITHFVEVVANASVPVLKLGLFLHGLIIYIGLTVTALIYLQGAFIAFGKYVYVAIADLIAFVGGLFKSMGVMGLWQLVLNSMAANPFVWVAAAVIALGALVFLLVKSKDATQRWGDSLVQTAKNATTFTSGLKELAKGEQLVSQAILATQEQISNFHTPALPVGQAPGAPGRAGQTGNVYQQSAEQAQALTLRLHDLYAVQGQLGDQSNLFSYRMKVLGNNFGGTRAAMVLLNQSGVTMNQMLTYGKGNLAQIVQQVAATASGFSALSYRGTQWTNDVEVMDQQMTDQYKAITNLNGAWDTFIGNVTASQTAFDTFEQGLKQIPATAARAAQQMASAQAAVASAQGSVNRAQGGGRASTLSLTSATDRLKAAQQSLAAIQANPSAHAAGVLAGAQARVASAQNTLNNLQGAGATSSTTLTAAQNRLTAAQDRLNALQKAGKPTLDGLNAASLAMNAQFAQSVVNANAMIDTWRRANISNNLFTKGIKLTISQMVQYAKGSKEGTAQLVALAQEAGYKGPNSLKELTKWLGNTHDATAQLKQIADQATIQESLLTSAMDAQSQFMADQLIKTISNTILAYSGVTQAAKNYGKQVANFGPQSQQAINAQHTLNQKIIDGGLAAGKTTTEIAGMIAKVDKIPLSRAIQIVEKGTGSFTVRELSGGRSITSTGQVRGGGGHTGAPSAMGSFITAGTHSTADDVIARVSKGELIVPAHMVRAGEADHMRGRIPGFQSGGMPNPDLTGNVGVLTGQAATTFNTQFTNAFTKAMEHAISSAVSSARSAAQSSPGFGITPNGPLQQYARKLLSAYGWGGQWTAFNDVVMAESGWNVHAANPSGAYGIPQALPGSKMASAGADWANNGFTQLRWMMGYIKSIYGSPDAAWAHEQADHWYGGGGIINEPVMGIGASGARYVFGERGEREHVIPESKMGGGDSASRALWKIAELLAESNRMAKQNPNETGKALENALNGVTRPAAARGLYSPR